MKLAVWGIEVRLSARRYVRKKVNEIEQKHVLHTLHWSPERVMTV